MRDPKASSDCAVCHRSEAQSPQGCQDGDMKGGLAISRIPREYTHIRVQTWMANGHPIGLWSDFRLCVWDADTRELRNETGNINSALVGLVDFCFEAPLLEPIVLDEEEACLLGYACHGDTNIGNTSFYNVAMKRAMSKAHSRVFGEPPVGQLSYRSTDYAGGTPPTIGSESAGNWSWVELF